MKKYNFMNQVYAGIDLNNHPYFPTLIDNRIVIGFDSYPTNSEEHEGHGVFSLAEVETLFEKGLTTDNLKKNEKGELFLQTSHMSYIQPIMIMNGIILSAKENQNLIDYVLEIGLAHEQPIPIQMTSGIKDLEILDDQFKISYTYKASRNVHPLLVEQIIVGRFKHFLNNHHKIKIKNFDYDKENFKLSFEISKIHLLNGEINYLLQHIDLCLFYMYNDLNINTHFNAIRQCIRDLGQFHWLNESFEENKQSRFWVDKTPNNLS